MKKKVLLFILPIVFVVFSTNAQNHTWDFSDTSIWPIAVGLTTDRTVDGLNIIAGGSATGAIISAPITFSDNFVSSNAMSNGSATLTGVIPTKRGLSFPVTGPCTVSAWVSTSSTNRVTSISDGTTVLGTFNSTDGGATNPKKGILTVNYTGAAGTIYVYTNNTISFAKISVTYDQMGLSDFKTDLANVFSNGSQVFVSNVKSNTKISVYAINGALVKTIETNSDTNFNLNSGLWIAKIQSIDGDKSVKLLIQ